MASEWHILGAGSIGSLFATALHDAGCATTLILRDDILHNPGANSMAEITIESGNTTRALMFPTSSALEGHYISHLLISTKAQDAEVALGTVAHRLDGNSQILLLVNGMGVFEKLTSLYPHLSFYCGTTTEAAFKKNGGQIVHAGSGTTTVGRHEYADSPPWFSDWCKLSIDCVWVEDISPALWRKLAINCAINPLTALSRSRNGELLSNPELSLRLHMLCDEIASIARSDNRAAIAADLHQAVRSVIEQTSANKSSMLQDVLSGRRTEIEFITGYLVSVAKKYGIVATANEKLLGEIRNIESHLLRG
jgi:2-dehydropantoate 2-reductase